MVLGIDSMHEIENMFESDSNYCLINHVRILSKIDKNRLSIKLDFILKMFILPKKIIQ